jgi:hypothetical protein
MSVAALGLICLLQLQDDFPSGQTFLAKLLHPLPQPANLLANLRPLPLLLLLGPPNLSLPLQLPLPAGLSKPLHPLLQPVNIVQSLGQFVFEGQHAVLEGLDCCVQGVVVVLEGVEQL